MSDEFKFKPGDIVRYTRNETFGGFVVVAKVEACLVSTMSQSRYVVACQENCYSINKERSGPALFCFQRRGFWMK